MLDYKDWDDEALQPKVTEGHVLTAKEHEKEPKTGELPTLVQLYQNMRQPTRNEGS